MFLINRGVRGKHVEHDLSVLSKDIDQKVLLERLRAGDETVIADVIAQHMTIILHIAGQYAKVVGSDDDQDYVSEGLLAVMMVCRKGVEHDNLTAAIVVKIHSRIATYIRVQRRHQIRAQRWRQVRMWRHNYVDDLDALIEKSIDTPFQRLVVGMRRDGYSDREIAIFVGESLTVVHSARVAVRERFDKLYKEY